MTGRLRDLTFGAHGEQHITVTIREDFRERFDKLRDADIEVEFKKPHKRRSLDANAYCWVLIDKLAAALSMGKIEIYRNAIRNIGGVSETICVQEEAAGRLRRGWEQHGIGWQTETVPSKIAGCVNVVLYYGSSTYDTRQMSLLIDYLIQDAKSLGIETLSSRELSLLKENWNSAE